MIRFVFFAVLHILLLSFSDRFRKTASPMLCFLSLESLLSLFFPESAIPIIASGAAALLFIIFFTGSLYRLNPIFAFIMIECLPLEGGAARIILALLGLILLALSRKNWKYIVIPASAASLAFLLQTTYYLPLWTLFPMIPAFFFYGLLLQKEKSAG